MLFQQSSVNLKWNNISWFKQNYLSVIQIEHFVELKDMYVKSYRNFLPFIMAVLRSLETTLQWAVWKKVFILLYGCCLLVSAVDHVATICESIIVREVDCTWWRYTRPRQISRLPAYARTGARYLAQAEESAGWSG